MGAVGLSQSSASTHIHDFGLQGKMRVACVNSPKSVTVSGECAAIDVYLSILKSRGVFVRKLKTDDKAYHSHLMKASVPVYEELLSNIFNQISTDTMDRAHADMFSTVTGDLVTRNTVRTPQYWCSNLASPVLFCAGLENLFRKESFHLLEIGPHPTLASPIRETWNSLTHRKDTMIYTATLSRGADAASSLLDLAGSLYLQGHHLPFEKINSFAATTEPSTTPRILHSLPGHIWNHASSITLEPRISSEFRHREYSRHELLGSRVPGGSSDMFIWRNLLSFQEVPWLQDHKLGQSTVFPGAGYLGIAIEGLCQIENTSRSQRRSINIRDVHFLNVLVLSDKEKRTELFTRMEPAKLSSTTLSASWWRFEITSVVANKATRHANGLIALNSSSSPLATVAKELHLPSDTLEKQSSRTWYNKLAKEGLCFGPSFQSLTEIHTDRRKKLPYVVSETLLKPNDSAYATLQCDQTHPIAIDSLLQSALIASAVGSTGNLRGKVPVSIAQMQINIDDSTDSPRLCKIRATSEMVGVGAALLSAELESPSGQTLIQVDGVRTIPFAETLQHDQVPIERTPALRVLWKPDVTLLPENSDLFSQYTDQFAALLPDDFAHSDIGRLAGALDLITHQNPRLHILEISNPKDIELGRVLDCTAMGMPPKRFESYTKASMTSDGELMGHSFKSDDRLGTETTVSSRIDPNFSFNAVVIPSVSMFNH